jgi:hypothetical protein
MKETGFATLQDLDLRQGLKTAGIENPRKPEFSTQGSRVGTTIAGRRPRA